MLDEAKNVLFNRIRIKLSDFCIPSQIDKILELVSDCLFGFSIDVVEDSTIHIDADFLDMFIDALKIQGRSECTLNQYRYVLNHFLKTIKTKTSSITADHIRSYLKLKKEQQLADSSLESYRLIFSSFFTWLYGEGLIDKNPMINIGSINVTKKMKKTFSDVDIEKLKIKSKNPRDIAIVTFLLATACRVSEVVNLNINDINFETMECIVHGKGNKKRKVYLDEISVLFLKEYLAIRNDSEPALFVSLRAPNKRISADGIRYMLKTLGVQADVNHVHPHKFRRTKATSLIKHGMSINEVSTILGHNTLDTTMEYIVLDDDTIKHDYQKFT